MNLFKDIPVNLPNELFDTLHSAQGIKIERIVSQGHRSPETGWYDQVENEWVIVLQGAACITYDDEREFNLEPGDSLNIPARQKHKVVWTAADQQTIWLAVFYDC